MIIVFVVGVGVGYYLTPQYQLAMYDKISMDFGVADRWVDLRYINAMIAHHRGAILLAEQLARESRRPEMQALAASIKEGEPRLISELYAWKTEWFNDSRKVKDPIVSKLGTNDEKFDLRFLNSLIAHHELGIEMTKQIRAKSSKMEVLNNADSVEKFLTDSLKTLKGLREGWYGVK